MKTKLIKGSILGACSASIAHWVLLPWVGFEVNTWQTWVGSAMCMSISILMEVRR